MYHYVSVIYLFNNIHAAVHRPSTIINQSFNTTWNQYYIVFRIKVIILQYIVKLLLKFCFFSTDIEEQTTFAPPRLYYDVEVKLVNLGDGFTAPTPGSPDFEIISNMISESFGSIFEKLPGYYQVRLDELRRQDETRH